MVTGDKLSIYPDDTLPTANSGFQVSILRDDVGVTLVLRGELDLATVWAAEAAVEQALREPADRYVLDLADLTFVDARGVIPFVRLANLLEERGVVVTARSPTKHVAFVFSLTPVVMDGLSTAIGM